MLISLLVTGELKPHTKQFGGAPFPPQHDFEKSLCDHYITIKF